MKSYSQALKTLKQAKINITDERVKAKDSLNRVSSSNIYSNYNPNHFPNNDKAIAGILGQIDHETGGTFNWKEKEKGGFGGHGLFMFTKGRHCRKRLRA